MKYWNELNGLRFNELPSIIQKGLLRRGLSAIVLLTETTRPNDRIDIRTILFERLNTGGEKLNPQELRNAIYRSEFNKLLHKLADEKLFKTIWGIPHYSLKEEDPIPQDLLDNNLYKTMTDCELVLRYFTIKLIYQDQLKGSIKNALDRCMIKYIKTDSNVLLAMKHEYQSAIKGNYEFFGNQCFVLPSTGRKSRPLYDALMVSYSHGSENKILRSNKAILESLRLALNDPSKYDILVGRGNTVESIKLRVGLGLEILYK